MKEVEQVSQQVSEGVSEVLTEEGIHGLVKKLVDHAMIHLEWAEDLMSNEHPNPTSTTRNLAVRIRNCRADLAAVKEDL